jgi:hypothetical protein
MTIDEAQPLFPIGNVSFFADYGYDQVADIDLRLPILVTDEPYPGEFADPVSGGAFSKTRPIALPTTDSVRIPVDVRLADGYQTEGAELAHPTPFSDWTENEMKESWKVCSVPFAYEPATSTTLLSNGCTGRALS